MRRPGGDALCSVALLGGWAVSYWRNKQHVDLVESSALPELRGASTRFRRRPPATSTLLGRSLTVVRGAAEPAAFALDAPPLLNTLGLYQGDKLDAAGAESATASCSTMR